MGFFHQLRVLLWKNFVLKRRSLLTVTFETLIPLVLFVILIFIRKQQPSKHVGQTYFTAMPLPSSGIIPVLQTFCPSFERDPFGFPDHPNSGVEQFLNRLDKVVRENKLFTDDFSLEHVAVELDAFHNLINDKGSIEQHFALGEDFSLDDMVRNNSVLETYFVNNMSVPRSDAHQIMHNELNLTEIFHLLYGYHPKPVMPVESESMLNATNATSPSQNASDFTTFLKNRLSSQCCGAVFQHLPDEELFSFNGLLGLLTLQPVVLLSALRYDQDLNYSAGVTDGDALKLSLEYMNSLLSPTELQAITCNKKSILSVYDTENSHLNSSGYVIGDLCNRQDAPDIFKGLSAVLKDQLDIAALLHKLNISDDDLAATRDKALAVVKELDKFVKFQETLNDLYNFALDLPGDNCPEDVEPTSDTFPSSSVPPTRSSSSSSPSSRFPTTPHMSWLDWNSYLDNGKDEGNFSGFPDDDGYNISSTMATTLQPVTDTIDKGEAKPELDEKSKRLAQLYKLWAKMQYGLCGQELKVNDEGLARGDIKALHLTRHQKKSLGLLLHVLFSNPRILYAPNTTDVNELIDKASDMVHLMQNITHYARLWRNISQEIRDYMHMDTTQLVLSWLGQMEDSFSDHPLLFQNITKMTSPDLQDLILNHTYINTTSIEHRLDVIDNAACGWLNLAGDVDFNVYRPFEDEESLIDYILNDALHDNVTVFASLIFEVDEEGNLPPHIVYKIRQNTSLTDRTDLIRRRFWAPGSNHKSTLGYYTYGFVWIQDIIERAIINKWVGRRVIEPGSYMQEFPYPCFISDNFMFMIEHIMPMMLIVSWVYYVAMFTQSIVYEKEVRLKEVMKMMGLSNAVHWVAWFIVGFSQMSLTIVALICILRYGEILIHSDPVIVWLTLTIFAMATICFCFLVSVLFSKAKLAAACAGIIYFTSYVPCLYIAIREESLAAVDISSSLKTMVSILSTTAFGLGARYFALFEENGVGIQWNNISQSPVEHDSFNLLRVIIMMLLDTVVYCLLTWYIEGVHPGSYGLPRPWYFPFQRSYWLGHRPGDTDQSTCCDCCVCCNRSCPTPLSMAEENQASAMHSNMNSAYMEPDPTHLPLGVSIEKLSKVYQVGGKLAVNKLSLKFYEGQITSFLGHNGAGKTTTISMLTGLFPPTSGTAHIYGCDIRSDMTTIRKSLGMCPQHNALFDRLTVEEHIWFYCLLKGVPSSLIKSEMTKMIMDIGLLKKRNSSVNTLSGGMQRKLSVAIAFVGGSRTVILDEPTAGVDPCARRAIWELLIKYKQGRTIILCTHHMDEADILGDRIAILSNGQLKCIGSSLFLKATFGDGYQLTLIKKPASLVENCNHSSSSQTLEETTQQSQRNDSFVTNCRAEDVTGFIRQHVTRATLSSETLRELTYTLPVEAMGKGTLEGLFEDLTEEKLESLNLSGYGLMDSSLEEVFLKVADKYGVNKTDGESLSDYSTENYPLPTQPSTTTTPEVEVELSNVGVLNSSSSTVSGEVSTGQVHSQTRGGYSALPQEEQQNTCTDHLEGTSSYLLTGILLQLSQFQALMIKRFHYTRHNCKSLFTQLILPAFFVCIAMSVALSAPKVGNFPPLVLTPSQYHPLTYPDNTYSVYANEALNNRRTYHIYRSVDGDADPTQLTSTFRYPAGIGASCVLKTPWNGTLDRLVQSNNYSSSVNLRGKYFDRMCEESFKKGEPLSNYVPEIPHEPPPPEEAEFDEPAGTTYIKEKTCRCSADGNSFICPPNVGLPEPDKLKVITSDILLDISGRNVSEYLLYTTDKFRLKRYGGTSFGNVRTFVPAKYGNIVPDTYRSIAVRNAAIAWFSHKGYHSPPTFVNVLNNAILRANLDPDIHGNPSAYGITVINHPVNKTGWQLEDEFVTRQSTNVLIAIFIIVAMSFVPAGFVVFLVIERSTKAKHLQYVSGMRPVVYWASNFIWDMMAYLLPATCCVLILILFDVPAYSSHTNLPGVITLFLLYGFSMTPIMYPASFLFSESSSAYVTLIVLNLFTGVTSLITTFILEIFNNDEDLASLYTQLDKLFLLFPNYCLGKALMDLSFNEYMNEYYYMIGMEDEMQSPYQWELLYRIFVIMGCEGIVAFIFTLLCECRFFIKPRRKKSSNCSLMDDSEIDEDVKEEKERVLFGLAKNDVLCIKNLSKMYKTKRFGSHLAVDKLCLGVPQGECFGLLGVNGAGKTTTFKMLTGDESITEGDAYVNGHSVYKDMLKVQRLIGYCPQFDALFDELTAREHLTLYARLKGIPTRQQKKVVDWAVRRVALTQYANKPAGSYSGGNKRKLSTAIALLGHPPVIFMDEPTTGMDPHSRRFLWDLIRSITQEGRSVILTSHSMEECEVLCTRLAIMVNSNLQCLGSAQHLRNKFGDGYYITIRVRGQEPDLRPVSRFFSHTFPYAVLKEEHYSILQYEIPLEHVSLKDLFGQLQDVQESLQIEDYSISQMTLDNVFVNFAKQQLEKQEVLNSASHKRRKQRKLMKLQKAKMEPLLLDDEFDTSLNTKSVMPLSTKGIKKQFPKPWKLFKRGSCRVYDEAPAWFEDEEYIDEESDDEPLLDLRCSDQEPSKKYCEKYSDGDEPLLDLSSADDKEGKRKDDRHVSHGLHDDDEPLILEDNDESKPLHTSHSTSSSLWYDKHSNGLHQFDPNKEIFLQDCDDDVLFPLDETTVRLSLMDLE
ncbi:ATP-binding cassette sub-family A member 2-like isoform X2 [Acanthaster planci]|uniref:ATP-binding cassette sub-family A member 2 n=1 Tax=Acanthaster planci TaxID=133434 RepID=A0A8B7XWN6_ACAPL|nr:ATP-binding cassette sub-family A member 2-like isoform X2 [Acanthaster planci]